MKIYTKKGDKGDTQLVGKRVRKTHERVEAYGTIDELNSFIGIALSYLTEEKFSDLKDDLLKIQHELFDLGGDLANVTGNGKWASKEDYVPYLETRIDYLWAEVPPLKQFILPGGEKGSAYLHICRTIARRAERKVIAIDEKETLPPVAIQYLNRLSDFLFAAARVINYRSGREDILYERGKDILE
ncbi:cob(I)yrinic acid a,c-diamide adenosyltransferase [Evansella tamaricis]|uniref:Corrinoid adenosyltransferase n=1 Tax=Evansella tamaricis TaxID=2069301 RepID=A0ABS6JKS5_9BACI|nr:cob(I)yrinic acid a,c-diamide adenosyltransferase [Evansella tamaricis]MBU9714284.1 cob(I)yrinic acid a,c-diamide adenosyltransferase [Evansella tamaricis]